MADLKLSLNSNGILGTRTLPTDNILLIHLTRMVQQASGLHARISISIDDRELAHTVMNVERLEDRIKLANAAYKDIHKDVRSQFTADDLKIDLAYTCSHAWDTWLAAYMPREEPGREDLALEYMLEPYILKGGGTILFGPPKAGKSYLGMAFTQSINANVDTLWPAHLANSLWINLERSASSVLWRLAHINKTLGLSPDYPLRILNARGKRFKDVRDLAKAAILQDNIGFVAVDSLSRMGVGSLVKDESINEAIDMLNALGTTWLALAHTPTASEEHVYGGNLWIAGGDIMLNLSSIRKPHSTGLRLETFESNDTPISKPQFWAMDFLPDLGGLKTLRPSSLKEFPELKSKGRSDLVGELVEYIQEYGHAIASKAAQDMKKQRTAIVRCLSAHPDVFHPGPRTDRGTPYYLSTSPLDDDAS